MGVGLQLFHLLLWLGSVRARLSGPGLIFMVRTRTLRIRAVRSGVLPTRMSQNRQNFDFESKVPLFCLVALLFPSAQADQGKE